MGRLRHGRNARATQGGGEVDRPDPRCGKVVLVTVFFVQLCLPRV